MRVGRYDGRHGCSDCTSRKGPASPSSQCPLGRSNPVLDSHKLMDADRNTDYLLVPAARLSQAWTAMEEDGWIINDNAETWQTLMPASSMPIDPAFVSSCPPPLSRRVVHGSSIPIRLVSPPPRTHRSPVNCLSPFPLDSAEGSYKHAQLFRTGNVRVEVGVVEVVREEGAAGRVLRDDLLRSRSL